MIIDIWAAFNAQTTNTPAAGGTWKLTNYEGFGSVVVNGVSLALLQTFPQSSPNNVNFTQGGEYSFEYEVCDTAGTCCSTTEFKICLPEIKAGDITQTTQCTYTLNFISNGNYDEVLTGPINTNGNNISTGQLYFVYDAVIDDTCSDPPTTHTSGPYRVSSSIGNALPHTTNGWLSPNFQAFKSGATGCPLDPVISVTLSTTGIGTVEVFAFQYWADVFHFGNPNPPPITNYTDLRNAVQGALGAGGIYTSNGVSYNNGSTPASGDYYIDFSTPGLMFGNWHNPSGVWLGIDNNSSLNMDTTGDGIADNFKSPTNHWYFGLSNVEIHPQPDFPAGNSLTTNCVDGVTGAPALFVGGSLAGQGHGVNWGDFIHGTDVSDYHSWNSGTEPIVTYNGVSGVPIHQLASAST